MWAIIKTTADQVAEYALLTIFIVTGGVFAIVEWRKPPYLLPIAGAFMGPVGGMAGAEFLGQGGAILGTFIGCFAGPGAAVMLTDRTVIRRLVHSALDKYAPEKKHGDTPQEGPNGE